VLSFPVGSGAVALSTGAGLGRLTICFLAAGALRCFVTICFLALAFACGDGVVATGGV
jgi:hypothetical protein